MLSVDIVERSGSLFDAGDPHACAGLRNHTRNHDGFCGPRAQGNDVETPDDGCGVASNCGGIGGWRVILLGREADNAGAESPSDGDMVEDPEDAGENRVPSRVGSIDGRALTVGGGSLTIDVAAFFSDPDGDDLTHGASSSDEGVATASVSGSDALGLKEPGTTSVGLAETTRAAMSESCRKCRKENTE